jgi:hypothetical protein
MQTKTITILVVSIAVVAMVGWDLVADVNSITGDTISEILLSVAHTTPILPVVLGVVMGHLFGDIDVSQPVIDWVGKYPIFGLIWGIATGFLFWNQNRK